jgi:hypothetical protein
MRRKTKPPMDDYPPPWEDGPISRERWRKNRDRVMAACQVGRRPMEWWLYELGRDPPENETQVLYTMGVLRADELHRLMKWWRMAYDEANEVISSSSYGTIKRTPEERQKYLNHHQVPPDLVKQWDFERTESRCDTNATPLTSTRLDVRVQTLRAHRRRRGLGRCMGETSSLPRRVVKIDRDGRHQLCARPPSRFAADHRLIRESWAVCSTIRTLVFGADTILTAGPIGLSACELRGNLVGSAVPIQNACYATISG